eukprot:1354017-Amorphochlora_amoeboformis.AAC.2
MVPIPSRQPRPTPSLPLHVVTSAADATENDISSHLALFYSPVDRRHPTSILSTRPERTCVGPGVESSSVDLPASRRIFPSKIPFARPTAP